MANELKLNVSLSFVKSKTKTSKTYGGLFTVTGDAFISQVQTIGNTEEAIQFPTPEFTSMGYLLVKSLVASGGTNIYLGLANISSQDDARGILLKPGDIALFRVNTDTFTYIHARSVTGTGDIEYTLIEA